VGAQPGLGVALDAAARGFSVLLIESHDFAKGTSSRATKLLHGGVRYLAQGNISLVREALHERTTLLRNAPHLAQPLAFVVPSYHDGGKRRYGAGLTAYDLLAGKAGLGKTRVFSGVNETRKLIPQVAGEGLKGGVSTGMVNYDDARLALSLARTAAAKGALVVNYCKATQLQYEAGKVCGVLCEDTIGGRKLSIQSRCVVNATGVWVDALREETGRPIRTTAAARPNPWWHPAKVYIWWWTGSFWGAIRP